MSGAEDEEVVGAEAAWTLVEEFTYFQIVAHDMHGGISF